MPFFESERAGVLVSRLTADVQSLTTFVRQVLVEVVGNMLLLVVTLTVLVDAVADARRRRLRLAADPARLVARRIASGRSRRSSRCGTASRT